MGSRDWQVAGRLAVSLLVIVAAAHCTGSSAGSSSPSGVGGASGGVLGSGGSSTTSTGAGGAVATSAPHGSGGDLGAGGISAAGGGGGSSMVDASAVGGAAGASAGPDARPGSDAGSSGEVAGPAQCPAPPSDAPADAVTALNAENAARVAMGVPCASLVLTLCTSAQNHCAYYTANQGSSTCAASSAHSEISGCPDFTGADPGARIRAAGYNGNGWSECMAFLGDPAGAVKTFIDSVYHRTPVLSPWYRDMGYGGGSGCDTIDFGPGAGTAKTVTAFYPYDGQTGVPLSFNGAQEGPTPPVPSSGWPSGYPITLYGQGITVSSHQLMVDGDSTPLAHQWLDGDSTLGSTAKVMYADAPLTANTTYRVTIDGTTTSATVHFEWTFTTGAGTTTRPRRG